MSISSEITRISGNVSAALTAIGAKGVTIPSGANSDDLATLIAQIDGGGGGGGTRTTIVPEQTANYSERYNQINFVSPLVVGEVYIYTIDGAESQSMAFDNYGSVAIGSPETTIGFEYANGTMYLSIADSSLMGTHTVKVEQESSGGGGSATLITKTISANGTYLASDDSADGYSSVTVNVPSGASNVVTGTFKGTTTGAAMDVTLNYSGSGYPIAVMIYPEEGVAKSNGSYYPTVQRYAYDFYVIIKNDAASTPTYNGGTNDSVTGIVRLKNSSSDATSFSNTVVSNSYDDVSANSNANDAVKVRSNKKMSVMIAGTRHGFMANIDYRYIVYYSS